MKRYLGTLGLCAVMLLGGCLNGADHPDQAESLAHELHVAMQHQNWDAAHALYAKKFFADTSWDTWRGKLEGLHKRLGELKEAKPVFMQRSPRLGGDFYMLGFKLIYEKGVVEETLSVYQKEKEKQMHVTEQLLKYQDKLL